MPGDSLPALGSYEPPLLTGKYYPPIYEKRHRARSRREIEQPVSVAPASATKVDSQVFASVADSLRALVAEDEKRRKKRQYQRDLASKQSTMAGEVSVKAAQNPGGNILHSSDDANLNAYRPFRQSRSHTISPIIEPQDSSNAVMPLDLGTVGANYFDDGKQGRSTESLMRSIANDSLERSYSPTLGYLKGAKPREDGAE